jgi:adenylate cyclase
VLRAIAPARSKAEGDRTAYDWFALGYSEYLKGTAAGFEEAKKHLDRAIALEPRMTLAIVQRSYVAILHAMVTRKDLDGAVKEWERFARQAIAANPLDAESHIALAMARGGGAGALEEARVELERGLSLDPTSADVSVKAGWIATVVGQPQRGAELCDRAFRHNSMPVVWYGLHCFAAYYYVGRYPEAVDMVRRTADWIGEDVWRMAFEVAAKAEQGDGAGTTAALQTLRRLDPNFSAEAIGLATFGRPQDGEKIIAALTKANAPLCEPADKAKNLMSRLPVCDAERAKEAAR